ncbi:MAG: helicase-related protein [Myxococcota bacterium]
MTLPIETIRETFLAETGSVVITAPTGSGKSTQVPRWAASQGSVVVIEPRRVACKALASRVASLEGSALGERVGFQVRGESSLSRDTRLRFVTPGIALRQIETLRRADTVILDELHERRLDTDLLLALLVDASPRLVAMSATLDGPRVASHLGAALLQAEGRTFPVDVTYRGEGHTLPSATDLAERVAKAVQELSKSDDVLVFLPGKGEIEAVAQTLGDAAGEVLRLYGGLSLRAQNRVFEPTRRRKIVLSTNVAETSLTVPGIKIVVDSGLVRQTTYHRGRAHLALMPVALDAADQRAGRAGRTAPGRCVRLWERRGNLAERTPPEIFRESLVPLVLAAAACDRAEVESLPLLDPPKAHALDDARAELRRLGALDEGGSITLLGKSLFGLPLDASLGRLLVEAQSREPEVLQDVVDLVAGLASGRRLFAGPPAREDDLRFDGCDASALVRAIRAPHRSVHEDARRDAQQIARRLRDALDLSPPDHNTVDPVALREVALAADPRAAHVVRRRGKARDRLSFANGGTELSLARESAAWRRLEPERGETLAEAVVVFDQRAFGMGRERRILATCASACTLHTLREMGLGRPRLQRVVVEKDCLRAEVERVYAKKVLSTETVVPTGEVAEEALRTVVAEGRLFAKTVAKTRERLDARRLAAQLSRLSVGRELGVPSDLPDAPSFDEWLQQRVRDLGFESGADLALLSADDFLAEDLPFELRGILDELYPRQVALGDATYRVDYDLDKNQAILVVVKGGRSKPPPRSFLPRLPGLKVFVEAGRRLHRV